MICFSSLADFETNVYFHSILVAFVIATSFLTVIFNSVYIISTIKFTRNFFPSDVMYIMLSVSDFLAGFVYTPTWSAAWILALHQSRHNCLMWRAVNICGHVLTSMSLFTISCITVDIYLSILHPFFYDRHITNKRSFFLVTVHWIFGFCLIISFSVISTEYWQVYESIASFIAILSCVAISLMHVKIQLEMKRMCRKATRSNSTQINILKAKKKSSKTGVKILVTFILCFLPISLCFLYRNLVKKTAFVISYAEQIAVSILSLNPLLDPFIYYFRLSRIRSRISRLFNRNAVGS